MGIALERGTAAALARPARAGVRRRVRRTPAPLDRLDFIEGLRGLAALYVVLGHFVSMVDWRFAQTGNAESSPAWLRAAMAPFVHGHLAVAAFIVISGFCLQYALFRSSEGRMRAPSKFFRRRALRILPAYYAALALSILVTWGVTARFAGSQPFDTYLPLDQSTLLSHLFLVHNFSVDWMYKINGALWSIAIEVQLYLLFPLLVKAMWTKGRRMTLLASGLLALGLMLLVPGATKLYFWFLPLFVAGMVSAHLAFRPRPRWGTMPKAAFALGLVFAGLTWSAVSHGLALASSDLAFGSLVACVCYFMTVQPGRWVERLVSLKPLVALGTFSYSLYLIHSPIQQVLWMLKPAALTGSVAGMAWLFGLGLPTILLVSSLFSRVFERPFVAKAATHSPHAGSISALPLRARGIPN